MEITPNTFLLFLFMFVIITKNPTTTMSSPSDPFAHIGLVVNPDGSITRTPDSDQTTPPSSHPSNPVLTKDIPINPIHQTWARVYLPRPEPNAIPITKLPLIVYFIGSGFVVGSPASTTYQRFCSDIVLQIPAIMVSVAYRLGPEHRLPAAYEDGLEALYWIKTTNEEWLTKYADFSRCFLLGSSSGGNMVYNVGFRAITTVDRLMPPKIQGLILHQPFFGGVQRTQSEIRFANGTFPLYYNDLFTRLALPIGVNRDHEYFNPVRVPNIELLEKVKKEGWRFLVYGDDGDPLIDAQVAFANMLKENGVDVMERFNNGGYHGVEIVEIVDESWANIFYAVLKNFILA